MFRRDFFSNILCAVALPFVKVKAEEPCCCSYCVDFECELADSNAAAFCCDSVCVRQHVTEVWERCEHLMQSGDFERLDDLLLAVHQVMPDSDMLLAWLMATLPARAKLPSRALLYETTEKCLKERGECEPYLLSGLE